jgi:CDP-glycerol glycerophosphotransferase (TagB/SpsB family)
MLFSQFMKLSERILLLLGCCLGRVVPKDDSIWVFGAWFGHRYSDNSKYVFEYVSSAEKLIRAIWLTSDPEIVKKIRSMGNEAYLINSLKGWLYALRAKVSFLSTGSTDVGYLAAYGSFKVQLWHGTPLKMIKFDDEINENVTRSYLQILKQFVNAIFFPFVEERYDLLISPSSTMTPRLSSAFRMSEERIALTGYPRSDAILSSDPEAIPGISMILKRVGASRIVLYAPTHRKTEAEVAGLFKDCDFVGLNNMLKENNCVLLVKMHYYNQKMISFCNDCEHVVLLQDSDVSDLNALLPFTDILITDYSSVFFDFLLLDRPIIFTPFDFEEYIRSERALYDDYNAVTPGPKCKDWSAVSAELYKIFANHDGYVDNRARANIAFNAFIDTNNSRRVVKEVFSRLN